MTKNSFNTVVEKLNKVREEKKNTSDFIVKVNASLQQLHNEKEAAISNLKVLSGMEQSYEDCLTLLKAEEEVVAKAVEE